MRIIYAPKTNKPYFLQDSGKYGRRIIKVEHNGSTQAFYESSGTNTGVSNTWFPFDGIIDTEAGAQLDKHFFVNHMAKNNFKIHNCRELTNDPNLNWRNDTEKKINEMLCRFGNCYYANISQALGGALWDQKTFAGGEFTKAFGRICPLNKSPKG